MSVPILSKDERFGSRPLREPSVDAGGVMTFDGVLVKTGVSLLIVVVAASVGWFFPAVALPAAVVALVVGLVEAFRRKPSKVMTLLYSGLQGLAVGGISGALEGMLPGVVIQAVLATIVVFAVVLGLFASGKFRTTSKSRKIFYGIALGYLAFSLVNVGLMVTGVTEGMFGLHSETLFGIPLGFLLGVLGTALAVFSLVLDFEFVENGIQNKLERNMEWRAAFGLVATLVWLYLELLRLISLSRN